MIAAEGRGPGDRAVLPQHARLLTGSLFCTSSPTATVPDQSWATSTSPTSCARSRGGRGANGHGSRRGVALRPRPPRLGERGRGGQRRVDGHRAQLRLLRHRLAGFVGGNPPTVLSHPPGPLAVPRRWRPVPAGDAQLPLPRAGADPPAGARATPRSRSGRPLGDRHPAPYYDGNSQGGILGGALTAVAPDFTRAVLGVPGDELLDPARAQLRLRPLRRGPVHEPGTLPRRQLGNAATPARPLRQLPERARAAADLLADADASGTAARPTATPST